MSDSIRKPEEDLEKRGVTVDFLKRFLVEVEAEVGENATMGDVVFRLIIPRTRGTYCRYVDLLRDDGNSDSIGTPSVFLSHCWGAKFKDTVGGVILCCNAQTVVWVDIFAVLQGANVLSDEHSKHLSEEKRKELLKALEEEQKKDLDFVRVVLACDFFILVAVHLASVAALNVQEAYRRAVTIPQEDRRLCAFFRVWCLVEIAAALKSAKNVVMVVGRTDEATGEFLPEDSMLEQMSYLVDVAEAEASVEADRLMILEEVLPRVLGQGSDEAIEELNLSVRRACAGAFQLMDRGVQQATLRAAATGDLSGVRVMEQGDKANALGELAAAGCTVAVKDLLGAEGEGEGGRGGFSQEVLDSVLFFAAQSAQVGVAETLVAAGANASFCHESGLSVLHAAAISGDRAMVSMVLSAGAAPNTKKHAPGDPTNGMTPLTEAAARHSDSCVEVLLASGADPNSTRDDRLSALEAAAQSGNERVVGLLLGAGANPNAVDGNGVSALHRAGQFGFGGVARLLLDSKADPTLRVADTPGCGEEANKTAREWAEEEGHVEVAAVLSDAERRWGATEQVSRAAGEEEKRRGGEEEGRGGGGGDLRGEGRPEEASRAVGRAGDEDSGRGEVRSGAGCSCSVG